ncbi:MAG: IS1595 family transposase [Rhodospirillaceae bacterium]|nr:IS1595 family transposase [Rhodospirillaceae bacterium]MDE0618695.1 IS1595 family transposase [Rhodospirillaceae bacterium]
MAQKGPGKAHREGISLIELTEMFPDEAAATAWFESKVWPEGRHCPHCGSCETVEAPATKKQPYWCPDCRKGFSVRIGTALERSRVPLRKWVFAIYLEMVSLKGVSSMRLHRDLKVTQKTAWFMLQRIREAWADEMAQFAGPVEADETYIGGLRKNMSQSKRKALKGTGTGAAGKTIVAGVKDRDTNRVSAGIVPDTSTATLTAFVERRTDPAATVYTDEHSAYLGLDRPHEAVNHSAGEYVRDGEIHTQGIESFWSMFERGFHGTYHKISPKHLGRYVRQFAGKHNVREADTADQMASVVTGLIGKRLMYRELIADNGLASGARAV